MARTPEIHNITKIGASGSYATGGRDFGPHRNGGGGSGDCNCSWSQIVGKPNFSTVAVSGNYNDLTNRPVIPAAYNDTELRDRITALEQGSSGSVAWNDITGKPNFATVATSGSYNDLANKPTIPEAYDDTALVGRVTALEAKTDQDTKPELAAALTVSNAVGQATAGKVYAAGTSFEAILRDILSGATPVTYTITFNPNGGTVSPTSGTTGTDGKLSSLPTPTHATDTFTGWFTAATGGTAVTTNTVFTENTTIFAQWQAATRYTITFNPNGGSVTPTSAQTGTDGKLASLPTPTHATDTFKGWFTQATGGNTVTTATVFSGDTTIFAQWQAATQDLPIFGTINDRFTLEEIPVDNSAGIYMIRLAEQMEGEPVYFDVPAAWNAQVHIWNPLTNQWVTHNNYVSSSVTHEINGQTVQYVRWTDMSDADTAPYEMRITWTV